MKAMVITSYKTKVHKAQLYFSIPNFLSLKLRFLYVIKK